MSEQPNYGPAEVIFDAGVFLESPRWHQGAYWFSDIGGGKVYRIDPADGKAQVMLSGMPGPSGLGWTSQGDMLLAALHDSTIYRVGPDGKAQSFVGPEQHGASGTNDMATARGRTYVTCSGYVLEEGDDGTAPPKPTGSILLIDHETGACQTVASGYYMPNGVAITPDGATLIVAELYARRVLKFPILSDGTLGEAVVFAEFDHIVDGLCLDADGGLWLGTGLDRFQRVDAQGEPAGVVEVPGWSCVASMLGGADGRTLIMVTNFMERPDDILSGKAKGRILTARVDVPTARFD